MHTQRDATLNFNVTKGMLFLLLFPWFPKWKAWKVSSLRHSDQPVFVLKKLKQTQANSANPVSSLETQTHPRWSPDWSLSVPQLILLWILRKKRKFHEGTSCVVLDSWWCIIPKQSKSNIMHTSFHAGSHIQYHDGVCTCDIQAHWFLRQVHCPQKSVVLSEAARPGLSEFKWFWKI